MSMNENGEQYTDEGVYERARSRYMNAVEQWDQGRRIMIWVGMVLGAIVLIAVGTIIPGGNYVSTIFGIPAGFLLAAVFLGVKHLRWAKNSGTPSLRERLSPKKRTRVSLISAVVTFVVVGVLSSNIPYAAGGAMLLAVLLSLADFMRLTPDERYRQQEQILDPRDYDEEPVYVAPEEVAGDFSWEGEYQEEQVYPDDDNVGQGYPPPIRRED